MSLSDHVSAINAGVTSFKELDLNPSVLTINVHSNCIETFHGLECAPSLTQLDASSNNIKSLSGLCGFKQLVVLNLASNHISDLRGIGALINLRHLNVSYNNMSNLDGLVEMNGPSYKLEALELHGNLINNIQSVFASLGGVLSLSYLMLGHNESHGNPVCKLPNYRVRVFEHLPQLISLDNTDRNNQPASYNHQSHLDGLSLDITFSDLDHFSTDPTSSICQPPTPRVMPTPTIDSVLSSKRAPTSQSQEKSINTFVESFISSVEEKTSDNKADNAKDAAENDQEKRLKYLESQLANLVAARQETAKNDSKSKDATSNNLKSKQTSKSDRNQSSSSSVYGPKSRLPLKSVGNKTRLGRVSASPPKRSQGVQEKETYLNLVKELETERERRWKSEQAARKLAELVRNLSNDKAEGRSLQDMAAETAEKLKQTIIREREKSQKINSDLIGCREKIAQMSDEIVECKRTIDTQKEAITKAESNADGAVASNSKILAEQAKRIHESEVRASGAVREVETQKANNLRLEKQVSELQELLVATKRQHEKERDCMFSVNSPEFKSALSKEMNRQETCHREEIRTLQGTISELKQRYAGLEDEFRQALFIEANRFTKVNSENECRAAELQKMRALYRKSKEKEEKCQSLILELTSVAKEQKLKITELINSKREANRQFEDRLSKLEVAAENGRKNGVQLELVKQEKSRLISQLAALQTVVDGLRDERKLWGHELAQQGASLAQDRGRLESKIESLKQEITSLKKQNERDLDALRIKTKILEDQTESIHKMKQALVEKDQEFVRLQDESLDGRKKLEQELEDLTQDNAALNEQITALIERKNELKEHVADSEKELDDLKTVHSRLVKKWSEKGQILSRLETQVKQMKESYDKKIQAAVKERDGALESKSLLTNRLAKADSAFREQLEAANAAHQNELDMMMKNCGNELEMMKGKVASVEEEMREVLRDAERQKKAMESRFHKVTSVFKEMQDGFK